MADSTSYDEMVAYYDQLAPRYESKGGKNKPPSEELMAYWKTLLACYSKHLSGCDVLEVACGPGTWTHQLAPVVSSIFATDLNESTLVEARKKSYPEGKVSFAAIDGFTLEDVNLKFNAGFAKDWFSHIPKSRILEFLDVFHSKIGPGGRVVLGDTYYADPRIADNPRRFSHVDGEGNIYHNRRIPDDPDKKLWKVIKNCPSETELRQYLKGRATDIDYHIHDTWSKRSDWCLSYTLLD